MAKLSVSRAWDETREVLRRDGKLLVTVALALLVLPGAISDLVTPPAPPGKFPEPGAWIGVAAIAILIGLVGQLAIIRLAIGPGRTVGEAIAHGARRAPFYIGAMLTWILPFGLLLGGLVAAMGARGPSAGIALLILMLSFLLLFLLVRLILAAPVATAEGVGPLGILRRSWELTSGNWWRLFGFVILFLITAVILIIAVGAIATLLARLIFGVLEPMSVGMLLVSLITQVVAAAASVVFLVMLARLYLQRAGVAEAEASVPTSGT